MSRLRPVKPWVWLELGVWPMLETEASRWAPRETGGVLIGYVAPPLRFVVTAAVGPGPRARHGRFWFVPDEHYHQEAVASIYNHSGRTWTYLGDWHTHPGGSRRLGWLDRLTLRRIAASSSARARTPLMGIVHGDAGWNLTVWVKVDRHVVEAGIGKASL
jgi:integrative and conjugative element protein (TIGR02256 family)